VPKYVIFEANKKTSKTLHKQAKSAVKLLSKDRVTGVCFYITITVFGIVGSMKEVMADWIDY